MTDLFATTTDAQPAREQLGEGAVLLRGCVGDDEQALLVDLRTIIKAAPFRHLVTPGGHTMSVAMTNCGRVGWVSDARGYRYDPVDPDSGRNWPEMPPSLRSVAARAAAEGG